MSNKRNNSWHTNPIQHYCCICDKSNAQTDILCKYVNAIPTYWCEEHCPPDQAFIDKDNIWIDKDISQQNIASPEDVSQSLRDIFHHPNYCLKSFAGLTDDGTILYNHHSWLTKDDEIWCHYCNKQMKTIHKEIQQFNDKWNIRK